MLELHIQARGKINLALDVLRRREDGYHDLRMVMQSVSLSDEIILRENTLGRNTLASPSRYLPTDSRNLAMAALELFCRKTEREGFFADIVLNKHVPVCAGMGGGSSDAAAVLRALWQALEPSLPVETVLSWALELGSDVPFCLLGGTRRAEGRGEILTELPPLPDCTIVLCKPLANVSTKKAFMVLDQAKIRCRPDIPGLEAALRQGTLGPVARRMYNVFEPVMAEEHKDIARLRNQMIERGALGAVMTGSGPTVFGLFENEAAARPVFDELVAQRQRVFLCKNSGSEM